MAASTAQLCEQLCSPRHAGSAPAGEPGSALPSESRQQEQERCFIFPSSSVHINPQTQSSLALLSTAQPQLKGIPNSLLILTHQRQANQFSTYNSLMLHTHFLLPGCEEPSPYCTAQLQSVQKSQVSSGQKRITNLSRSILKGKGIIKMDSYASGMI